MPDSKCTLENVSLAGGGRETRATDSVASMQAKLKSLQISLSGFQQLATYFLLIDHDTLLTSKIDR